ncbi:IclR family transcriptional regulator [Novosphingobium sp.]|uniref:IclR family transcriptional regulator n=1 Tax=Novosphingobium sp. TaxID=1874826 RepID=UPI0035B3FC83
MRQGTPKIGSVSRSIAMLEAVLEDREGQSIDALARQLDLPRATAHRQVHTLIHEGFLTRLRSGQLVAGPRLLRLVGLVDNKQLIVAAAAPVLHRVSARLGSVVQLGTLENDMVTYRIKTGEGAGELFTKVGLQLEAYCTGIGKVLLAHLPRAEREAYLANGPFPALTKRTITSPDALRAELDAICQRGFGFDCEEIAPGLSCLAVPIRGPGDSVQAAISVSRLVSAQDIAGDRKLIHAMQEAACEIEQNLVPAT